ncbi:MAG TPA: Crp/Fnr family transcriptional regulator [Vicinamibacterales bacterium]|nr:Crp/Fnr family transcriptional regulator [Vicinamibacterales bacterium]
MSKQRANGANSLQNFLLAALPDDDLTRIVPQLEVVPLRLKELLHKPGEPIDYVYFPGGGFCSIVTVLEDGSMVEAATVGREGLVGLAAALYENPSSTATMAQSDVDVCYRMSADDFREEMDRCGAFHHAIHRYSQALMAFVMQSAACNAAHSIEQRLARWLLVAQDRMGADEFYLTQEFIAMMLGASRSTVTTIAGELQDAGFITYRRGKVTILDRAALEAASCECYKTGAELLKTASEPHSRN